MTNSKNHSNVGMMGLEKRFKINRLIGQVFFMRFLGLVVIIPISIKK